MSDLDDLIAALCAGDPNETVGLDRVRAMAAKALEAGWIKPVHHHVWNVTFRGPTPFTLDNVECLNCGIKAGGLDADGHITAATDPGVPEIITDPMFPVPEGPDDGR